MMNKYTIRIEGHSYPARMTMGAMLLFKRTTGKDVAELDTSNIEEMLVLMWACAVSASRAEGDPLPYDFTEFCDHIDINDVNAWNADMAHASENKKKAE